MEDRIGLLGANGNGKSTLVKILAGRLKPLSGTLRKSSKLKIGYFAQHQLEELTLDYTAYQHMMKLMPLEPEVRVRAHLGKFGFQGQRANVVAQSLSGGEKARLVIAIMTRDAPQLLLLDEPTNHLDVDSREALVQSLNAYEGAVVMVSHDAHLLETTCDRLWIVDGGTVRDFDGDLVEYKRLLLDKKRAERQSSEKRRETGNGSGNKKDQRKERAREREQGTSLRRAVQETERRLEKLNKELAEIEIALANPGLYDGDDKSRIAVQTRHKNLRDAVAQAEEKWLEASSLIEV
jgi:ATP-binding cassette subfamily F protein 3